MRIDDQQKRIRIGVRDFVAPVKDERWDLPVLPERLQLGTEVHRNYRESRSWDEGFEAEVSIKLSFERLGYQVEISGRADGLFDLGDALIVEEIKSVSLDGRELDLITLDDFPSAVLQLSLYCYALQEERQVPVQGRLVFCSVFDGVEEELDCPWSLEDIESFILERADDIIHEHLRYLRWLEIREQAAPRLAFPFPEMRSIQSEMLAEVQQAFESKAPILMEAPTGTGKTAVALYAALKYAYTEKLQVLFITAKTSGQSSAQKLLERVRAQNIPLSSVTISARSKVCQQPVVYCHADYCSAADDYHKKCRQSAIIPQLCEEGLLSRHRLEDAGRDLDICPFELSVDLARRVDVVICDYNYVFHPTVRLKRLFTEAKKQKWVVIVDEAHNLVSRAREYYSPKLSGRLLEQAKEYGSLRGGSFGRRIQTLVMEIYLDLEAWAFDGGLGPEVDDRVPWQPDKEQLGQWQKEWAQLMLDDPLRRSFRPMPGEDDLLLNVYRSLSHFIRVLDDMPEDILVPHLHRVEGDVIARILCLDPSEKLGEIFERFEGALAMSATLNPLEEMRLDMGLPTSTILSSFASPFPPERRAILIDTSISTRYKNRDAALPEIARRIFQYTQVKSGRYALFTSSYRVLKALESHLMTYEIDLLCDSQYLDDRARQALLHRLSEKRVGRGLLRSAPVQLLMAVLGGSFSEGIEWPMGVLDGVIIVGPGLPSVSFEQKQLQRLYDGRAEEGFRRAFINPGLRRVVQAAGRLIRREEDRGMICLIGERFSESLYHQLLPEHWYERHISELFSDELTTDLTHFWASMGEGRDNACNTGPVEDANDEVSH